MNLDIIYLLVGQEPTSQYFDGGVDAVTSDEGELMMFDPALYDTAQQLVETILAAGDGWIGHVFLTKEEFDKFSKIL